MENKEAQGAKKKTGLRRMTRCALFAALLCICSPIVIPIGPVPVSLGIFAVMLASVVLGPWDAVLSIGVFLLLGICGLPLFSGGNSGLPALVGPTGGYVWSYALMAILASSIARIPWKKGKWGETVLAFAGCVVGTAVCYLCGTLQYMTIAGCSWSLALSYCVLPFIPFDLAKALCACVVGVQVRSALRRSGNL